MPRPKTDLPSPAEMRALVFLNLRGSATVTEYLKESGLAEEGRAYTSVMSLLNVLYQKGYATRKEEKRAYRYTATIFLEEIRTRALKNVLKLAFGGALEEMKAAVAKMGALPKRKK